jgi:hypothetical protein
MHTQTMNVARLAYPGVKIVSARGGALALFVHAVGVAWASLARSVARTRFEMTRYNRYRRS